MGGRTDRNKNKKYKKQKQPEEDPVRVTFHYSKTPIYHAPIYRKSRFTAANFLPQIGLNMHIVNKQNPHLPRTPIYHGCFLTPETRGKSGFYCTSLFYRSPIKPERFLAYNILKLIYFTRHLLYFY